MTRRHTRALGAFDARYNAVIDQLLSHETPAQHMLRINGPAIKRACEEMDAEMRARAVPAPGEF
jgi:hypothetical protein